MSRATPAACDLYCDLRSTRKRGAVSLPAKYSRWEANDTTTESLAKCSPNWIYCSTGPVKTPATVKGTVELVLVLLTVEFLVRIESWSPTTTPSLDASESGIRSDRLSAASRE